MTDTIGKATYEIDATSAEAGAKKVVAALNSIKKAVDSLNKAKVTGIQQLTAAISAMAQLRAPSAALVSGITALGAAMSSYKAPSQAAVTNTQNFLNALSNMKAGSSAVINRIATLSSAFGAFKAPTAAQTKRVVDFFNAVNSLKPSATFNTVVAGLNKVAQAASVAATEMAKLQTIINGIHMRMTGLPRSLSGAANGFKSTAHSSELLKKSLFDTVAVLQTLTGFLAFREILGASANLETARSTLLGVSDSAREAADSFSYLAARSLDIGVSLTELGRPFARFTVAAKNAGFSTKEIRDAFDNVSGAARNFGLSAADTAGVVRALEQSLSKGKFMAEEIRLQLGDRLPIAMAALAQATGKTTRELNSMFEAGVLFTDQYFKPFTQALFDMSGGEEALARNSEGLNASLSRLQTGFALVADAIGRGGLNQAIKDFADALVSFITSDDGQRFFLGLGKVVAIAGRAFLLIAENIDRVIQGAIILYSVKLGLMFTSWVTGGSAFIRILRLMFAQMGNLTNQMRILGVAMKGMWLSTGVGAAIVAITFLMTELIGTTSALEEATIAQNDLEMERARLGNQSAESIRDLAAAYAEADEEQRKVLLNEANLQKMQAETAAAKTRTAASDTLGDYFLEMPYSSVEHPGQVDQVPIFNVVIPDEATPEDRVAIESYTKSIIEQMKNGFQDLPLLKTTMTDFGAVINKVATSTSDTDFQAFAVTFGELYKSVDDTTTSLELAQMLIDAYTQAQQGAIEANGTAADSFQELSKGLTDWHKDIDEALAKERLRTISLLEGEDAAKRVELTEKGMAEALGLSGSQFLDERDKILESVDALMARIKANDLLEAQNKADATIKNLQDEVRVLQAVRLGYEDSVEVAGKLMELTRNLQAVGEDPDAIKERVADLRAFLELKQKELDFADAAKTRTDVARGVVDDIATERLRYMALTQSKEAADAFALEAKAMAATLGLNSQEAEKYRDRILRLNNVLEKFKTLNERIEAIQALRGKMDDLETEIYLQKQFNAGQITNIELAKQELAAQEALSKTGMNPDKVKELTLQYSQQLQELKKLQEYQDSKETRVSILDNLEKEIEAQRAKTIALTEGEEAAAQYTLTQEALSATIGMTGEEIQQWLESAMAVNQTLQDITDTNKRLEATQNAEKTIADMQAENQLQLLYNMGLIDSVELAKEELAVRKALEDADVGADDVRRLTEEWRKAAAEREKYAAQGAAEDHLKELQDEIDALGLAGAALDEYNRAREHSENIEKGVSQATADQISAVQEVIDAYKRYEDAISSKDKAAATAAYNELVRLHENAQTTSSFIDRAIAWLENLGKWGSWAASILKVVADVFGFLHGQGTPDFALPQDPATMDIKWSGGGGGGKDKQDVFKDWADGIRERIADEQLEMKTIDMTAGAIERLKAQQDLENEIKKEGLTLTAADIAARDELLQKLEQEIDARARLEAIHNVQKTLDDLNQEAEAIRMTLDGRAKSLEMAKQELEIRKALGEVGVPIAEIDGYVQSIQSATERNKELNQQLDEQQALADGVGSALSDAFKSAILDAKSFMEVLADLALQLAQLAFTQSIFPAISSGAGDILGGLFSAIGLAKGGVVSGGNVLNEYGKGSVFTGPTPFAMSGNKTGVIGEAGPEAGLPLVRMPNGDLGVQYMGGNGDNYTENNIHVSVEGGSSGSAADDEKLANKIAKTVQQSLDTRIDQRLQKWTKPGAALGRGGFAR